jgi:hypothetical protein
VPLKRRKGFYLHHQAGGHSVSCNEKNVSGQFAFVSQSDQRVEIAALLCPLEHACCATRRIPRAQNQPLSTSHYKQSPVLSFSIESCVREPCIAVTGRDVEMALVVASPLGEAVPYKWGRTCNVQLPACSIKVA